MIENNFADHKFSALLFDMDGTILNSIAAAEEVWGRWAHSHGLDVPAFLKTIHGVRASETVAKLRLPNVDPEAEAAKITQAEIAATDGVVEIPGAGELLRSLPDDKWAVVTSAPLELARSRMAAAGLPIPKFMVTAEDVSKGKPDPECYFRAAEMLGVRIEDCLVFEDAEAGIQAAENAGAEVVVVTSVHKKPMTTPRRSITDYREHLTLLLQVVRRR